MASSKSPKQTALPVLAVESIQTADLIPYARNSRTHDEAQVAQIAGSIREFGFTNPVLIDGANGIIAGHGRVMAAGKLGLKEVPCIRLGHLTETQKRAYIIADNKLALNAGWDAELLKLELQELKLEGVDLGLIGFSNSELDEIMLDDDSIDSDGLTEDDDVPSLEDSSVSKPGDIWILGSHRVLCGDCTIATNIEQLLAGQLCDGCWTDPPYNVNYESGAGKIANDNMGDDDFAAFLYDAYVSMFMALKEGGPIYVAHADTEGLNFRRSFKDAGFKLSGCLVWVKPQLVLGRSDYQWRHEPILYGWKPGAAHTWFGGRANTTVFDAAKDLPLIQLEDGRWQIDMGPSQLIISGSDVHVEEVLTSVIRAEKPKRSAEHPTMKPIELILPMLKNSTKRGAVILDLFGGSGSTLIACEKSGRSARLTELDPRYVDVIVTRWQEFTGKQATLESTGKTFDEIKG
jgi:DNA modification methylase